MGANTTVYVQIAKTYEEIVEVQAATLEEAICQAEAMPNVDRVIDVSYEKDSLYVP
jgi:hypothetical protein